MRTTPSPRQEKMQAFKATILYFNQAKGASKPCRSSQQAWASEAFQTPRARVDLRRITTLARQAGLWPLMQWCYSLGKLRERLIFDADFSASSDASATSTIYVCLSYLSALLSYLSRLQLLIWSSPGKVCSAFLNKSLNEAFPKAPVILQIHFNCARGEELFQIFHQKWKTQNSSPIPPKGSTSLLTRKSACSGLSTATLPLQRYTTCSLLPTCVNGLSCISTFPGEGYGKN